MIFGDNLIIWLVHNNIVSCPEETIFLLSGHSNLFHKVYDISEAVAVIWNICVPSSTGDVMSTKAKVSAEPIMQIWAMWMKNTPLPQILFSKW